MRIRLVAIGTKMPNWVETGVDTFIKRFPSDTPVSILAIPPPKRGKNADIKRIIHQEGEAMLEAVGNGKRIISLDVKGKPWSTAILAKQIEHWKMDGRDVDLLIGGPEGLSDACKQAAEQSWSLSPLTLPHPLVRIVVVESLYRAWSVTQNHPYHRE